VDPVAHFLGAAAGWGGNPLRANIYMNMNPEMYDGKTPYTLDIEDVPVDGFLSIIVYSKTGYFEPNSSNAYSFNSVNGSKNTDGSITIRFGGDPKHVNYLPITEEWIYAARLFRPKKGP
jgi:hypothetical protein